MKLTQEHIDFIQNVVKTGQSINIDNVIIEPGVVRAIDEARTVVIYQNKNVPDMPFGSIGLNRINVFLTRLEIAKTQDNFTLDVVSAADDYARSIIMRGTGTKIDYRCANPTTIQAPQQINDEIIYRIQLSPEAVSLLQKGVTAMGSETVSIIAKDGVSFELTDINSDAFSHTFAPEVELLDVEVDPSFVHRYPVKTLISLFKQNPTGCFEIGRKGMLKISVNDIDIYVLPQV